MEIICKLEILTKLELKNSCITASLPMHTRFALPSIYHSFLSPVPFRVSNRLNSYSKCSFLPQAIWRVQEMKLMGFCRRYLCTASTSAALSGGRSGVGEGGGAASASTAASESSEAKSSSGANSGDGGKSQGSGDAGKPVRGSVIS